MATLNLAFYNFCHTWAEKNIFPDSIKFYYLEEAEFTTEIIKILPPPHDCALNMREEGERKKNGKGKYVDISEVLSLL